MNYQDRISNIFSINGELSLSIKGFRPRTEQIEMAHAVGESIQNKSSLVIEAGTGTGKTFAYLAPALVFGNLAVPYSHMGKPHTTIGITAFHF